MSAFHDPPNDCLEWLTSQPERIKDDIVEVHYRPRQQDTLSTINVTRVINCAGPGADYDRIQEPLIRDLL